MLKVQYYESFPTAEALVSYRFDRFSGDLTCPKYGIKSLFSNASDHQKCFRFDKDFQEWY